MWEKLIDNMVTGSADSIKANEGDYLGEDGLLYCGKCNTRKQTEIVVFDKIKRPYCLCKCEAEKREAADRERRRADFEKEVNRKRRIGFPESDMQNWTFANDDMTNEPLTKAMLRYSEKFPELRREGKGLLLYGPVGTGKTFAACEVANALIDKGYSVLVTNFARIVNTLQGLYEGKQEYIDSLNRFDLLVLDDLGAERKSDFMQEQVYSIIDARYRSGRPMIITSNLSIQEMTGAKGMGNERIYDRILERCFPIEVAGKNRRSATMKAGYHDMKELLFG